MLPARIHGPLTFLILLQAVGCEGVPRAPVPRNLPPPDVVATPALVALGERTKNYVVTDGPEKGQACPDRMQREADQWLVHLGDRHTVLISTAQNGNLVTSCEQDLRSDVRVLYDPPLVIMPARLAPGEPYEGQCKVRILNRADDSPRTTGTCNYKIELLGREPVETPAGTFDAFLIRTHRRLGLGFAEANVVIREAYVPKIGRILHRMEEHVVILGLLPKRSVWEIRLAR